MKRTLASIFTVTVFALTACGGVDKDGTADLLVKQLKESGTELTSDQEDCIKDAVKSYSGDELKELSENKASEELSADFIGKLANCMS
jgi:hypothetical protein